MKEYEYLAIGLGIGAAVSVFFASKPGDEAGKWLMKICFDAIDTARQDIRNAVAAGRAFRKQKAAETVYVL